MSTCHVQATDLSGESKLQAASVSVGGYAGRGEAVKPKLFYNPYPRASFVSGIPEVGKQPCFPHPGCYRHSRAVTTEDSYGQFV